WRCGLYGCRGTAPVRKQCHRTETPFHRSPPEKRLPPAGRKPPDCLPPPSAAMQTTVTTNKTMPAVPYYPVYFDYNKSDIRDDQRRNLANIAAELQKYNLTEVTVAGYTDRAGSSSYNQK